MLKLYNVKAQHMCGQLLRADNTVCSLAAPRTVSKINEPMEQVLLVGERLPVRLCVVGARRGQEAPQAAGIPSLH